MSTVVGQLSWENTHRIYHHDRPPPVYYTERMKRIWNEHPRSHPDCPFCKAEDRV